MFGELEARVSALEERLAQILRMGLVKELLPEKSKVRVELRDNDKMITHELPVLVHKTRCDKDYWMPDLGEQVLCIFPAYGLELGFVLGSFFSELDVVPVADPEKRHIKFLDGTVVEYDRAEHKVFVHSAGDVEIKAVGEISLKAPVVKMPKPVYIIAPPEPPEPVEPSVIPDPVEIPHG